MRKTVAKSQPPYAILTMGIVILVVCTLLYQIGKGVRERFVVAASPFNTVAAPVVPLSSSKQQSASSMTLFENNICKPECCGNSEFSCSHGCICKTKAQDMLLSRRGNNRSAASCPTSGHDVY